MLSIGPSLAQVIARLPEDEFARLLKNLGLPPGPADRSSASERITDISRIDAQLDRLNAESRQFLSDLLLSGGYLSWSAAGKRPTTREALAELDATALVYHVEDQYFGHQIALPQEFADVLWKRLLAGESQSLVAATTTPRREQVVYDASPFFQDLYQLLSYARQEPLPLTLQGNVFKRVETKMVQKFWPGADRGLERIQHLEHFAQLHSLLEYAQDQRCLLVAEDQAHQFFSRTPGERHQAWFDYGFHSLSSSNLPQLLAAFAACLAPEQWLDMEKIPVWLTEHGVVPPGAHVNLSLHATRLQDVGIWEGDRRRARLTDAAYFAANAGLAHPVRGQALVQPTGEVMVPPESPWEERWAWDAIASLVRCDRMTVYRITKEGLERALDLGRQFPDVLRLMSDMSKSPLPANVRSNLEDWHLQLTRHRILEVTLVHSQSAADSNEIESALGPSVLFRLSSTDLVIPPASGPAVIRTLNRAGIAMRNRIERPGRPRADAQAEGSWFSYASPGLRMSDGHQIVAAHLIATLPELPDYQQIEAVVTSAIHHRRAIAVRHWPPGHGAVVEQELVPYQMQSGWLQGTLVGTPRLVNIFFQSILAAKEVHSP